MDVFNLQPKSDAELAEIIGRLDTQWTLGDDEVQASIGARRRAVQREIELRQRAAQRARGDMRGGEDY
jgi:hypothetical protein